MMDASILRSRRHASLLFPVLVALTAGPGILSAANLLQTYASNGSTVITSVTLTCNTATGPGASATIVVRPLTALVSPNQIIVSATPLSASGTVNTLTGTGAANVVITAPGGGQTLTAAITSLTYTISLATTPNVGCVGLTTAAPTFFFNHIAGTTSVPGSTVVGDVGMIANTTLTNATSGLVAPATMNLTCIKSGSTYYPGAAQTVSVTSTASNGTPFTVDTTVSAPAAWAVLNPSTPGSALATSGTPITFTVAPNSVCNSLPTTPGSNTATTTIHLINAPMATDKIITVTLTVNAAGTSSLVVNPSPVNITCAKSAGGAYTPNYPQMVSVTSAAGGGTAFTVDKTTSPPAAWLVFTPTAPAGTAGVSPITFTLSAAAGCGAYAQGTTNTTTVHLLNAPSLDKVFTVTLQIVPTTILAATPGTATVSYVKGSGTAGKVDINITSTNGSSPFFSVNTATLPIWLTVDSASGIAPKSLRFSSTTVADTLAPGTYAASVLISVSGYGDLPVPISLLLTSKASQLSVQGSTTQTLSWTIGQALPTTVITAISTGTPIAYTATTGGTLGPVIPVSQQNGLAYSFGTPINVSFSNQIFAGAQPGTVLTGTVTLTWGSPASTIVVTFKVNVVSPGATVSGLSPASVPTGTAGYVYTVVLTGTGFVPSTDVNQKTKVGVVTTSGAPMVLDAAISANVVNPSNITLTITVPNGVDSAGIPFAAGGSVNIGVCNPVAGVTGGCSIATGVAQLFIGTNPIIQAVTSSSAFLQGVAVSVAPYDIISIFGANFCPSCTSSQLLTGSPDATTLSYATSLVFDSTHSLSVTFQATSDATSLGSAPLLFANNSQINLLVPSGIAAQIGGGTVDIIVNYGSGSFGTSTLKSSAPFTVTAVATDPGIFTIGADGQGNGAALDVNYNLISSTNPAGIRTGALELPTS